MTNFSVEMHPALPARELVSWAEDVEAMGFDTLWVADSHLIWRDVVAVMGAIATATQRVALGTGVTQVITRHTTVLASVMATLVELAGENRIKCGIGLGDSSVETIGLSPIKRAELEEAVSTLRTLWNGDEAKDSNGHTSRLQWSEPMDIPIYYGSSGPNMLRDGGRIADGVIAYVGVQDKRIQSAISIMSEGAKESGKDLSERDIVFWVPISVDTDSAVACANVKPHAARALLHGHPVELTTDEEKAVDELRRQYDYYGHMAVDSEHSHVLSDELAKRFAVAGTSTECVEQLQRITGAGVDSIGLIPMGHDRQRVVRDLADQVLPNV